MSTSTEHSPLSPNDVHPAKRARMASPDRGTPAPASASATDQRSPSAASFVGAGGGGGVGLSSPPTGPPSEPTPTAGSTADGPGGDRSSSGADKASSAAAAAAAAAASSFRNVSACNRCRLRKNRCDQKLPSCSSCERASVACVGYDPITKRQIPRRWVPLVLSLRGGDALFSVCRYPTELSKEKEEKRKG